MTDPSKHCCKCNDRIEKYMGSSLICENCAIEQATINEKLAKRLEREIKVDYGENWDKVNTDGSYLQINLPIADIKQILYSLRSL
jgi:hypothetical protein